MKVEKILMEEYQFEMDKLGKQVYGMDTKM